MKILHVCINAPYIEGWGYQENLLPSYLFRRGVESVVIASNIMPHYLNNKKVEVGESMYEGVKIIRLKCKSFGPVVFAKGFRDALEKEKPDAVFHHNLNATTLRICEKYCTEHKIPLSVDNHADYINCNQNKIYQTLYYKWFVGKTVNRFSESVVKYYGVTHSRCSFLKNVFCVDKEKIAFLPIGLDVDKAATIADQQTLKQKYGFPSDCFVVTSGGKMGIDKGTSDLILAVERLKEAGIRINLLLFGTFTDEATQELANSKSFVKVEGWCDREKTLELLKLSDVAVWPIHHTTLCEDAIACETPLLIRKTETTEHLVDGNGMFMNTGNLDELYENLLLLVNQKDSEKLDMLGKCKEMKSVLSYHEIASTVMKDFNLSTPASNENFDL